MHFFTDKYASFFSCHYCSDDPRTFFYIILLCICASDYIVFYYHSSRQCRFIVDYYSFIC